MVYHLAGGNTDYDPTLMELPSTSFEAMDGNIDKFELEDSTQDDGGLIMRRSLSAGRPVRVDENIPTKLLRHGPGIKRAKLLDVNQWLGFLVCQTFKDIVEEFEPGVHQFFPMEYFDAKGEKKIGEGYWLVICQRLDTLHDTLCIPPRNARGFMDWHNEALKDRDKSLDRVVFSKEKIRSHHMWKDKFHSPANLFSNELAERLIEAGLTGLYARKYEEA